MKFRLIIISLLAALSLSSVPDVVAQEAAPEFAISEEEYALSLDENIATPAIPKRYMKQVQSHMDQLRRELRKAGLDAAAEDDGRVVCVTIPCHELFAPNEVQALPGAAKVLQPLRSVVIKRLDYKVIVAVYADDTGDELYADRLTEQRAVAIDDILYNLAGRETYVIAYGLGKDDPVKPNDSILNRRANRRVEIFIVPTLNLAKSI